MGGCRSHSEFFYWIIVPNNTTSTDISEFCLFTLLKLLIIITILMFYGSMTLIMGLQNKQKDWIEGGCVGRALSSFILGFLEKKFTLQSPFGQMLWEWVEGRAYGEKILN